MYLGVSSVLGVARGEGLSVMITSVPTVSGYKIFQLGATVYLGIRSVLRVHGI